MNYTKRWYIISELGEGGQGKVSCVLDLSKFDTDIFKSIGKTIEKFTASIYSQNFATRFKDFQKSVVEVIRMENPINQGALKVLHKPEDAKDPERAKDRIKKEIEAMSKLSHANLLKILDHDSDLEWFVSQFHPRGTLIDNKNLFTGNFVGSLRSFRPLVEGVSQLHKDGWVHRDIKPENVFLDSNNNLVLGDFGLIFFTDVQHTRISGIFENVGSRDWMPGWAMGMRIEDIKPTFDVFCLGKLLWAMVSNTPLLRLWYYDKPQFNIEKMFPNAPYINLAKKLFENCIVENEEDCLPDATALLEEVDNFLTIIDRNADWVAENVVRPCKVCGIGNYEQIVNQDLSQIRNFGLNPTGARLFKIFTCNHCGNAQLFYFPDEKNPPHAWPSKMPIKVMARRKRF